MEQVGIAGKNDEYVCAHICIYVYIQIYIYIYIYSTKLTWPGSNLSRSSLLWLFQLSTRTGLGNLKVIPSIILLVFFFSTRFFIVKCSPNSTSKAQGLLHVPLKHHKNKVEYHHCKPLKWCLTTAQGVFWRSFRPVHSMNLWPFPPTSDP